MRRTTMGALALLAALAIGGVARAEWPRYQEVLANLGSVSRVTTPAELAAFQVAEIEKWRKAVREAGIPLE